MTVQLYPGAGVPEIVNLASLISLDDAGFEDGILCYRGIDQETIEHLVNSSPDEWPAIEVVNCNVNGKPLKAVINGYHRWEAAKLKKATTIMAQAGNYASEAEVIEAAFRANMRNGRGASTGERSQYALWLFWQDPSDKPNLSAIARKVGLNQSTVSRYISKEMKRLNAEEEAEKSGSSVLEITETERLLKAIRRYMEQETAFFAGQHGERSVKKRAASLLNHLNTMKDKGKQRTAVQDLQTLVLTLNQIQWTGQDDKRKNA